nr:hypothetical protein L203_04013 [Cryptococcus depauperatus CBS 7841]
MPYFLRGLLVAVIFASVAHAKSAWGQACSQANTHLDQTNYQLVTDCVATTYCAENGTCAWKGCRKDVYPFGYNDYSFDQLPPLCPSGEFCPDEGDHCLTQVPVGGTCQKDRDDQCAPPPNRKEFAGYLNINGTVCLQYTCYYANLTVGQTCVNDNTAYTAYKGDGSAYAFIVSRDNCANGHYCNAADLKCYKSKRFGDICSGNKECLSYNCEDNGKCGKAADDVIHPPAWQYVFIGLSIVILIVAVMTGLWLLHKRWRIQHQTMLEQYYNEQIAYRQSIMSMSLAKQSLLNLPPGSSPNAARASLYDCSRSPLSTFKTTAEADQAWTSAADYKHMELPPNLRRDSTSIWSDQSGGRTGGAEQGGESQSMLLGKYVDGNEGTRYRG